MCQQWYIGFKTSSTNGAEIRVDGSLKDVQRVSVAVVYIWVINSGNTIVEKTNGSNVETARQALKFLNAQ